MSFRIAPVSTLVLLALLAPFASAQLPPLAEKALATMDNIELDEWSYVITTLREGRKTVERHDATRPENTRWQLLVKDDQSPTADELAEYTAAKNGQREARKRHGDKDDGKIEIAELIDPGSVTLLSEDDTRATYNFRMKADDDEGREFAENVRGTLVVNKAIPYVERIEMQSTDEIRPVIGVKIAEFHMSMKFGHDPSSGAVLPGRITTRIKGRAFMIKKIDEDVSVVFSDYERPVADG